MINLIFDATILLNAQNRDAGRSGAFFVAQNVFKRLNNSKSFRVFVYYDWNNVDSCFQNLLKLDNESINDFEAPLWKLCFKINKWMWKIHGRLYKKVLFRKPFALGILVTKYLMCMFQRLRKDYIKQCSAYISPLNSVPLDIKRFTNLIFFTILHDTIPFWFIEDCGSAWANELNKVVRNVGSRDFFFCVSNNSFLDFHKINPEINSKNTIVTHLAAADEFSTGGDMDAILKIKKIYNIPEKKKYVFCLSSVSPRKNFDRMVKSFLSFVKSERLNDLVVVVGGAKSDRFVMSLKSENAFDDELVNSVVFPIGYINDDEKIALYQNALFFVYTSQYEGFGLPPLEAMQCGCPVIVSKNSSLPEVVGDAGLMIDWDSEPQHIEAYKKLYENSDIRQQMKEKGLIQSKKFSWNKTVSIMEKTIIEKINSYNVGCSD